ncbi:MAG: amidohydrolase family protein [Gammaproteobacteria bacterium]|nr:amidohydrolase family protein [Gammaproteobacteria bacterium]
MIVDAHQHFWSLQRPDYTWLTPELAPLYRDYLPQDLQPLLAASGVQQTVLVQAAATEAETRYLCELAGQCGFVAGIVGWVDMARDDFAARLEALGSSAAGRLKGIRPMLQDLDDDTWVAAPALDGAFEALAQSTLAFDALVFPRHLPWLQQRLERTPGLRVVIDHAAKPPIARGEIDSWRDALAPLARREGVYCKLSGLLTEAGPDWHPAQVRPFIDCVVSLFGTERVLWGSDWPVLNLAADYPSWFELAQACLAGHGTTALERIFGGNAGHFYRLAQGD